MELRFREDLYAVPRWIRQIISIHELEMPITINMHHRLPDGTEADLVLRDRRKTIEVELKDTDFTKLFRQALARKKYFDYVYAAINLPTHEILTLLGSYTEVLENGVGIVTLKDDVVLIRARKRPNAAQRFIKLIEYMKEG